jgi:hypothetical protein
MAAIRMTHPSGAATHAYDQGETAKLEGLGWKVQTDEEFKAVLAAKQGSRKETLKAELASIEAAEPEVRKVGRPKKS